MNVKLERLEANVVKLEIDVDAVKFEEGMNKSYKKNLKNYAVPGFRKGKVPRSILEKFYGEQVLYEDAFGIVYPEVYEEVIKEQGLEPVEHPEIDIVDIGKGKNLVFTAKVTLKPEVVLGQYTGIESEKVIAEVKEEEIMADIATQQGRNARITNCEDRPAKMGDVTVINFEGFIDGVAFDGGKGEDYPLTLGSNSFIPGFEEQIVGAQIGTEIDVNVSFPEGYHKDDLAGQPALFKVTVKEIKEKILPELNDEFAQDISEFDTFEEYKNSIREKLLTKAQEEAKAETENKLISKIVEAATIEIPKVMVENRIDSIVREFDRNLRYQGLELKKYLEMTGGDYLAFRSRFEDRAKAEVKTALVLEKIGKLENVSVSDEDLDKNIHEMAEKYGDTYENFMKYVGEVEMESIRDDLVFKKTIDFLVDNAKII